MARDAAEEVKPPQVSREELRPLTEVLRDTAAPGPIGLGLQGCRMRVGLLCGFCTQGALRLSAGSSACYPEPEDQTHLNMVRHVPEFRGLGRQCSWKEGWKYSCPT
jgi:hypothetical protein